MEFDTGYSFALYGSCIYGTLVCLLRFFGETPTSGPVSAVCKFIAVIFYLIALIKVIVDEHDSAFELVIGLVKLAVVIGVTYWLISKFALASILVLMAYVIISWLITPIIITIIIL